MSRSVLITRPEPDASLMAARVGAMGFVPLVEPLLRVAPIENMGPVIESYLTGAINGIIVTSRHALPVLASLPYIYRIPLYVAGRATASVARDMGFEQVYAAEVAGAEALRDYISARCSPQAGVFLYLSGADIRHPLHEELKKFGFTVYRVEVYRAYSTDAFSIVNRQALMHGNVDNVIFFSPRTAETFLTQLRREGLEHVCASMQAFCLTENEKEVLSPLTFRAIHVAEQPETDALLTLLATQG